MIDNIDDLITDVYPRASKCKHLKTKVSLEEEIDDDQARYIIVRRCADCNFPLVENYATRKEIDNGS